MPVYKLKWQGYVELKAKTLDAAMRELRRALDKAFIDREGRIDLAVTTPPRKRTKKAK